jgi:hypothetical protein
MLLEGHQIIERGDPVKFAGVDEAHVNVADSGAVQGFKAQGVLPVQDRNFESTLGDVMPRDRLAPQGTALKSATA